MVLTFSLQESFFSIQLGKTLASYWVEMKPASIRLVDGLAFRKP